MVSLVAAANGLRSFSIHHPLGKRKFIRIVEFKIPKITILSIPKLRL